MGNPVEHQRAVFPSRFRVETLRDDVVEAVGHSPGGAYARTYYLPILGPGCLLTAERFSVGLAVTPDGYDVDLAALGACLGLPGAGRSSRIAHVLDRLCRFRLARWHDQHALYRVRTAWPPLTRRLLAQLPAELAELHPAA